MEPLLILFLCGDVMTGRGIDQVMAHSCPPVLYENYVKDARDYVTLAERVNGAIPSPIDPPYIWGDALLELDRRQPTARIINLETSITTSEAAWPGKCINYRMHPENVDSLAAANIDVCALANNHLLDWGHAGLEETVATLADADLGHAGAGENLSSASAPAILALPHGGRILVYACGTRDCGIPPTWAATEHRPGIYQLSDLNKKTADRLAKRILEEKQEGDLVVLSIHWGGNWGYEVPASHVDVAHRLIDKGAVDLVHGHSSHHPRPFEVYRGKLILYGCGDLINDYEGIGGHEEFRPDLGVLYFPTLHPGTGELAALELVVMKRRRFRLEKASEEETAWLAGTLNRFGKAFGTRLRAMPGSRMAWERE